MATNRQVKEIVPTKLVKIDRIFVASGLVITSGFWSSLCYQKNRSTGERVFILENLALNWLI